MLTATRCKVVIIAGTVLLSSLAIIPIARAATPDFTCPSNTVCYYTASNLTGTPSEIPLYANENKPAASIRGFGASVPWGSVHNNNGSASLELIDEENGSHQCIGYNASDKHPGGEKNDGYFILWSDSNCGGT